MLTGHIFISTVPRPFGLMDLHPPRMGVGDLRRTSYWAGVSLSYYGLVQLPNFHHLIVPSDNADHEMKSTHQSEIQNGN